MKTLLWSLVAIGSTLAFACPKMVAAESDRPDALVEGFVQAWNSHDMKAFEGLFTADAQWVTSFDARDEGRDAIVADLRTAHEGWAKTTHVLASKTLVRTLRADVAIIHFNLSMTVNKKTEPLGRTLLLVATQQRDGWRITAGQLTKPNCP